MSETKLLRVGVLGPAGTNGHFASDRFRYRFYGALEDSEKVFVSSHGDILYGLEEGRFDCGVVPIENCTTGLIGDVASFWAGPARSSCIVAEQWVGIRHCLVGHQATTGISSFISDARAYEQCRGKIEQSKLLLSNHAVELAHSTGEAALLISQSLVGNGKAAIASRFAADTYKLSILEADISYSNQNATRFHLLCRHDLVEKFRQGDPVPNNRTILRKRAIAFRLKHEIGAKADVMNLLKFVKANVTCDNSISLGAPEAYVFYIEFAGCSMPWEEVERILRGITQELRVAGDFQQCTNIEYP